MRNALKRIQEQFYNFLAFFSFNKMFILSFWDLRFYEIKNIDEKLSFAPIAFKLGSAYVSEDSKKKNSQKKNVENIFSIYFFLILESSEKYAKQKFILNFHHTFFLHTFQMILRIFLSKKKKITIFLVLGASAP